MPNNPIKVTGVKWKGGISQEETLSLNRVQMWAQACKIRRLTDSRFKYRFAWLVLFLHHPFTFSKGSSLWQPRSIADSFLAGTITFIFSSTVTSLWRSRFDVHGVLWDNISGWSGLLSRGATPHVVRALLTLLGAAPFWSVVVTGAVGELGEEEEEGHELQRVCNARFVTSKRLLLVVPPHRAFAPPPPGEEGEGNSPLRSTLRVDALVGDVGVEWDKRRPQSASVRRSSSCIEFPISPKGRTCHQCRRLCGFPVPLLQRAERVARVHGASDLPPKNLGRWRLRAKQLLREAISAQIAPKSHWQRVSLLNCPTPSTARGGDRYEWRKNWQVKKEVVIAVISEPKKDCKNPPVCLLLLPLPVSLFREIMNRSSVRFNSRAPKLIERSWP